MGVNNIVALEMESTKAAKQKQYRIDNADAIKESKKKYRANNADTIKATMKQYRIDHKDALAAYRIDNKDAIAAYNREYAVKNKEKEAARDAQRIHCDACECEVNRSSKSKHSKTKKHLDSIAMIQNESPH
jgi:hypothetical protein